MADFIVPGTYTGGAVLTAISASVILMVGPEWIWSLFGPPDLGPVAFETLERRTTPNDALACPPHFCKATSDLVPPLFAVDAGGLRTAMAKVIASEPRITLVHSDGPAPSDMYSAARYWDFRTRSWSAISSSPKAAAHWRCTRGPNSDAATLESTRHASNVGWRN